MQNAEIILVGGSGKTGSRVATRLEKLGINASRSSIRRFDWEIRTTWPAAAATGVWRA